MNKLIISLVIIGTAILTLMGSSLYRNTVLQRKIDNMDIEQCRNYLQNYTDVNITFMVKNRMYEILNPKPVIKPIKKELSDGEIRRNKELFYTYIVGIFICMFVTFLILAALSIPDDPNAPKITIRPFIFFWWNF
jgi:hypothetical protein